MTKKDEKELDKTIELLENDDLAEEYDQAFLEMIERLCNMDSKDYRRFIRYMRCERRARKHLGSMSFNV